MNSSPNRAAWLLPIGAGVSWGLIGPFVRHLDAAGLTGMEIIAVRSVVTALALFPWMAFRSPAALRVRPRDAWCFLGTGIGSIVFFNWCYFATINAASLSGLDGGSDINRFTIRFNCLTWQEKVNEVDYYHTFRTQARNTNTNIFADFTIHDNTIINN